MMVDVSTNAKSTRAAEQKDERPTQPLRPQARVVKLRKNIP